MLASYIDVWTIFQRFAKRLTSMLISEQYRIPNS